MEFVRNLLIFLILHQSTIEGSRILGIFPFAAKSHNIFFQALMKGLAKSGHQVDVISHYELQSPPKNYKTILNLSKIQNQNVTDIEIAKAFDFHKNTINHISTFYGNNICEMMGLEQLQTIFKRARKENSYELVISEFFGATCYFGLGHFLNVPVVAVTSIPEPVWAASALGIPLSTAFYPSTVMDTAGIKTFSDRLKNFLIKFICLTIFNYNTKKPQTEAMRKYLTPDIPSIRKVEKNISLLLTNNFHSLYGVRPVSPTLVEVGGLHISQNVAKLTRELETWMDESTRGVVYFSFGTAVRVETLPKEKILAFYSSFAKVSPVRFLIKIKDKNLLPPGLPENVKVSSWIPQISVLEHNNTRAFITHCGLLGLQESLYFGIPIIGIPLHSDQFRNVQIFAKKNMGIRINYKDITEKSLDDALDRILNDSSYRKAAKYESRIFRDRPMPPMETAIFWIEYVLRNGGDSLKSPAIHLQWWEISLLDIYLFLLIAAFFAVCLIVIIFKTIYRQFLRFKDKTGTQKLKIS